MEVAEAREIKAGKEGMGLEDDPGRVEGGDFAGEI